MTIITSMTIRTIMTIIQTIVWLGLVLGLGFIGLGYWVRVLG